MEEFFEKEKRKADGLLAEVSSRCILHAVG
jgi:hypothetical protein